MRSELAMPEEDFFGLPTPVERTDSYSSQTALVLMDAPVLPGRCIVSFSQSDTEPSLLVHQIRCARLC